MELSETYVRELKARLAEARRQGLWLSALDVRAFLSLLTWWARTSTTGWRRPHEGSLETIAAMRSHGVKSIALACTNPSCNRADRKIALNEIYLPGRRPLPDTMAFLDIPNRCRFRCVRCGGRNVRMMPVWPPGPGMGGAHGQVRPSLDRGRSESD